MNQEFSKKLVVSSVIIFIVFIIAIVFMTRLIDNDLKKEGLSRRIRQPISKSIKLIEPEKKPLPKLTPSNPEDYGMIIHSEVTKPKTQEEWDKFVQEGMDGVKGSMPQEYKKASLTIKNAGDDYGKRMLELEDRIKVFVERLAVDPNDEEAKARLEKLYLLKAIAKSMKQDIISPQ